MIDLGIHMGPAAGVFAGHAVIVISGVLLVTRFLRFYAAQLTREKALALDGLALSAMLVAVVAIVEALYYGSARLLAPHGVDLWSEYPAVYALRLAMASAVWWHMPSYFRWRGYEGTRLHRRIFLELGGLAAVWAAVFGVLW